MANLKKGNYSPQGIDSTKRMEMLKARPISPELKNFLKRDGVLHSLKFIEGFLLEESCAEFLKSYREDNHLNVQQLLETQQQVKIPAVFPQHFKQNVLPNLLGNK